MRNFFCFGRILIMTVLNTTSRIKCRYNKFGEELIKFSLAKILQHVEKEKFISFMTR